MSQPRDREPRKPVAAPYRAPAAMRASLRRALWLAVLAIGLSPAAAEEGPLPPCGQAPTPEYGKINEPLHVRVWHVVDVGENWRPPACTGWESRDFTLLMAAAGRFSHDSEADGLLRRLARVSAQRAIRYWSVTLQRWRDLVSEAYVVADPETKTARPDFSPDDLRNGRELFFFQNENTPLGEVVYRMRIVERTPRKLVFAVENATPVRFLFMPVFEPGAFQLLYFLDQEAEGVWRYYNLVRARVTNAFLVNGQEASFINRAAAIYRYLADIPTDLEPPAAPTPAYRTPINDDSRG